ncbi:histidinol-phosphatase [Desulfofustis glycolicus]|uniref:Histidinol-phosphatase n=1 Tax=Desulfofustis glycolicus DSM 9705 TaxID=1121409 RepID=A0A1M5XX41_9BACT|nr:histidinol-phosphatase [Desulfofustis glycolicus]MCB2215483.1 histidinol-phosphatase [Desulfobulbaceae bacterium]SHI04360.1 histidinol-phosphatase (PHP family) [Desulfofustis glycolicus DSM 9705]
MELDLSADGHVHTYLCGHATGTMEDYVIAAIDKGLQRITFLEHLEAGIDYAPRTWLCDDDFDFYFSEGDRLRSRYGDRLQIGLGVEVGYNPECPEVIIERLASRSWDRIGLSYHFHRLPDTRRHLNLLSRKRDNLEIMERYGCEELLSHYFDALIEAVATIPADVLCHLDAGLRHLPGRRFSGAHRQQIEVLLAAVRRSGMALEVNTSGFDLQGTPFPPTDILKRANELGIALIPGSDAHQPSDVGRYFDRLPELLSATRQPLPPSEKQH